MNIGSDSSYPGCALSNFAGHGFIVDGVECRSMEGFLQSLKFKDPPMQEQICLLVGVGAKRRGKRKKWFRTQTLYWKGVEYQRNSDEYQELLDKAFEALSENKNFQKALLATGTVKLDHSIGKRKQSETVLTISEFCGRLMKIRKRLQEENNNGK